MKKLTLLMAMLFSLTVFADTHEAQVLKAEYAKLDELVSTLTPDGKIGDFMKYKKMDGHQVLWDLGPTPEHYSLISILREHNDGSEDLYVSYYLSKDIIPGATVIRRFVGPSMHGWRNDTIDVDSGEYYGTQGTFEPTLNSADKKLLKKLGITLFE